MGKTKKTTFKAFDYMHCDDFAGYLEKQASMGWHFVEWGAGLKFEKGEPEQVNYAVEVFTKASENDLRPEPKTQEFAEYCEAAGWKLVDAKQKFCIFKKMDAGAVDILMPEERVRNSLKATFSASYILLFILYGLNAVLQWGNMFGSMFSYHIFSVMSFFNISAWTFLFMTLLIRFVYSFAAGRKLLKCVKNGQEIYIGNNKDGKKKWDGNVFSMVFLLALFLFMLLMIEDTTLAIYYIFVFAGTLAFSVILAKVRPEASTNIVIQVVFVIVFFFMIMFISFSIFSHRQKNMDTIENIPLQISDYRKDSGSIEDISISLEKNMLGSKENYFLFGTEENIHYEIYRSEYDWILNRIWKDELEKKYNVSKTECTKDWEADIAFRNEIGDYYVRYEDAILVFNEDKDISLVPEQISVIREKLGLR